MRRLAQMQRRQLSFEIPAPCGDSVLQLKTHGEIAGIEVGYDVSEEDLLEFDFSGSVDDFLDTFCPLESVKQLIEKAAYWRSELPLRTKSLCIRFVSSRPFSGGSIGLGIASRGDSGLVILEFRTSVKGLANEQPSSAAKSAIRTSAGFAVSRQVAPGRPCPGPVDDYCQAFRGEG